MRSTARVLRGGSWNNNQHNARSAARNNNHPHNRNNNIGFRVCGSSHTSFPLPGRGPAVRTRCEHAHRSGTGAASGIACRLRFAGRGEGEEMAQGGPACTARCWLLPSGAYRDEAPPGWFAAPRRLTVPTGSSLQASARVRRPSG
ncbi:hypothetical protein DCC79_03780 [bacterium]|nr:hypothetical protein [Chloroflexi bacterium CFX6]RIL11756.1 MAG: hypothetical protein DCC79_03780 [bacterium]